jgi:type I restriction enzyme M protein
VQDKDRFEIILANPPFGGKERAEVQQNFPIRTGETAFLFMQHFIKMLRAGGRAAAVIKNTFLSNSDNASVALRRLLLESCNLHTVLDCPSRNMGKTNPLNDADLAEFVSLQSTFADSAKSWSVDVESVNATTFDLSVKNPTVGEVVAHRSPQAIMDEIAALDAEAAGVLASIRELF